jgi:hypothetical protein
MLAWASNWVLTGWVWAQSGRATAQAMAKTNRFMGWLLEGGEVRSKALLLILYGYFLHALVKVATECSACRQRRAKTQPRANAD